ncbi:MAG: dihydroorotase [Bacteroidota bacterium]
MQKILIKGGTLINRGQRQVADLLIENGRITRVAEQIETEADRTINAHGKWVLPGIIDDQVHFREPGLTHKAEIYTEAKAAVAGGTTSFMEMPNTKPPAVTQEKLEEKYQRAAEVSLANYSFFMGASNDNLEEVLKTDPRTVCGVKIFMGSSTGNMLVDEPTVLDALFRECKMLIATHCEDEATIRANAAKAREQYGEEVPIEMHPVIRNVEGCYKSSSFAVALAKKYGTRLHILHISTKEELELFEPGPIAGKHITSEVCVHHLYFNADDYATKGTQVKCNPAVKGEEHRSALMPALLEDRLDIIATDHAPHTWEEKQGTYFKAPSGVPLVQHSLNVMLEFYQRGEITPERIVEKMSHAPAECFHIEDRGYLDAGMWADVIIVDPEKEWTVTKENIHYKCGWSPFEGHTFKGYVETTIVSGHLAYHDGAFDESKKGERMLFTR